MRWKFWCRNGIHESIIVHSEYTIAVSYRLPGISELSYLMSEVFDDAEQILLTGSPSRPVCALESFGIAIEVRLRVCVWRTTNHCWGSLA